MILENLNKIKYIQIKLIINKIYIKIIKNYNKIKVVKIKKKLKKINKFTLAIENLVLK